MRVVSGVEKQFDAYIKKTIKHTIISFARIETRISHREISLELLNEDSYDNPVSFLFDNRIEELFEDDKLSKIVAALPNETKKILKLSILDNYNSKEIARIVGKSDSRIRNIINDTLRNIRKKYKE